MYDNHNRIPGHENISLGQVQRFKFQRFKSTFQFRTQFSLSYLFDFTVLEEGIQNRNELMNSRNVTAPTKLTLTAK